MNYKMLRMKLHCSECVNFNEQKMNLLRATIIINENMLFVKIRKMLER